MAQIILIRTGFRHKDDAEALAGHLAKEGTHPSQIEIGYGGVGYSVEVECSASNVADLADAMENF